MLATRQERELYYWDRSAPSADAEVDYLLSYEGQVTAVEVKSSARGTLKSLERYLKEHPQAKGIVLSERNISHNERVSYLPMYFAARIAR